FEEQWSSIMVNDEYAQARSYLDALSKWHEQWALAYLKDYFFADMSSTQRRKSMNKLLKGFLDSKSTLTEFLAAFEQALDAREEAEQISVYKELVYSTCSTSQNPIKNQVANCLTRDLTLYVGCAMMAIYLLAAITTLNPPELELVKDYINFYSSSQVPGTPSPQESSSENDSQFQYMRIYQLSREIANKISTDPDKCADFMVYLETYLKSLYIVADDIPVLTSIPQPSLECPIINNSIKSKAVG
ncbi:9138_t:CDS:2, partial [Diversispora eburnea]